MTDTVANDTVQILVVEDAPEYQELLVAMLEGEGYAVARATDGETAIQLARELSPQVIVLDLSLPKLDGVEVCRRIRGFSDAYIVMLTGRVDEIDRVLGLEVGADDYVTKPFSARELAARVRAMLRRPRLAGDPDASIRTFGKLTIDPLPREVRIDGEEISLTKIEFDLLAALSSNPTAVFSRSQLLDLVWGPDWYGDDHVVDVHIANLRKKIDGGTARSYIRTIRGVGYRMSEPQS